MGIGSPYNGGFLDGYLDDVHICDQIKKASNISVRSKMEDVNGYLCHVLTMDGYKKHYTVWIDPNHGFNIRRAVIESVLPRGSLSTVRVDHIEIRKVQDRWVAVSGTRALADGHQTFKSRRTDIIFNPDFEQMRAFRMDQIPHGTRVINMESPALRYVWRDGKVVADENQ